jgi:hypothetical protein
MKRNEPPDGPRGADDRKAFAGEIATVHRRMMQERLRAGDGGEAIARRDGKTAVGNRRPAVRDDRGECA